MVRFHSWAQMFENFFKKIKTNVAFLKNRLVFLTEFKNRSFVFIISYYFLLFFIMVDNNLFFYVNQSFFGLILDFLNYFNNFYLTLIILFALSVKNLIANYFNFFQNSVNNQSNLLFLNFLYLVYIKDTLFINFNFFLSYLSFFFLYLAQTNYFLAFFMLKVRQILVPISWYTIFKRHSIFGYYRIARQNWVELKSEEVNFLKY